MPFIIMTREASETQRGVCSAQRQIKRISMRACVYRACARASFWKRVFESARRERESLPFGKLPPECGTECTLVMDTEAVLSVPPGSGNEGQIVCK